MYLSEEQLSSYNKGDVLRCEGHRDKKWERARARERDDKHFPLAINEQKKSIFNIRVFFRAKHSYENFTLRKSCGSL